MPLSVVILAAGKGRRMVSSLPKALHRLAGRTLLERVTDVAVELSCRQIYVVHGPAGELLRATCPGLAAQWVEQREPLGTGHAVAQAAASIPDGDDVLVLYGDVPLVTRQTLERLATAAADSGFGLLTAFLDEPTGYGRIVRDAAGDVMRVVEERDAWEQQKSINEINTGMMVVRAASLKKQLARLCNNNAQQEYLLTDVVELAVADGVSIRTVQPDSAMETTGVNSRAQLARLERHYQLAQAQALMEQGVALADPARFDLRGELQAGRDVFLDVNVVLEGKVDLGDEVRIGPGCVIRDAELGAGTVVAAHCVIEEAVIGKNNSIGPYARIRPGTKLARDVRIGNFVEVKKSTLGQGSKAAHLSYIGDSEVGKRVNIGAGAITCNYDGADKHKTTIGNDVFIGSNTELIAPVKIHAGAVIAAGAAVSKDVEAGALAVSKREQKIVKGWKRGKRRKAKR